MLKHFRLKHPQAKAFIIKQQNLISMKMNNQIPVLRMF